MRRDGPPTTDDGPQREAAPRRRASARDRVQTLALVVIGLAIAHPLLRIFLPLDALWEALGIGAGLAGRMPMVLLVLGAVLFAVGSRLPAGGDGA